MERYLSAFAEQNHTQYNSLLTANVKEDIGKLSKGEQMEEFMFLGLRMTRGVSKQEFAESFGTSMDAVYGAVLENWIRQGMLAQEADRVRLTDAGIDISNVVMADFLL